MWLRWPSLSSITLRPVLLCPSWLRRLLTQRPPAAPPLPQPNGLDRMRLSEETAGRAFSCANERDKLQCGLS